MTSHAMGFDHSFFDLVRCLSQYQVGSWVFSKSVRLSVQHLFSPFVLGVFVCLCNIGLTIFSGIRVMMIGGRSVVVTSCMPCSSCTSCMRYTQACTMDFPMDFILLSCCPMASVWIAAYRCNVSSLQAVGLPSLRFVPVVFPALL